VEVAIGVISEAGSLHDRPDVSRTYGPWLACVGLIVVTGLFIYFVGAGLEDDPRKALFSPISIAVVASLGALGVFLSTKTGFPSALDPCISNRTRFIYPFLIGLGLAVISIDFELLTNGIDFAVADLELERFNAPLPGSILLYSAGAVVLEVAYRLLPIPLVLWCAAKLGLPDRHRLKLFWLLAILTAVIEPFGQTLVAVEAARWDIAGSQFALGFAYNLAQAYWFFQGGFLSALSLRWGHYALWHIAYGGLICAC
jgi:hypothetical protein